jgi:hypothetical protein
MDQIIKINLSIVGGFVVADPDEVTLDKGDQLLFVTDDSLTFTVIIPRDTNVLASTYFDKTKSVFIKDVTKDSPALTPITMPNVSHSGLEYEVIASSTSADDSIRTDPGPNAPPKIIIISHT